MLSPVNVAAAPEEELVVVAVLPVVVAVVPVVPAEPGTHWEYPV